MGDLNAYSGKLTYKDICFDFVYDKKELRLIPPTDKKIEIWNWKMKELSPGVFTMGDLLTLDSPYLEGTIALLMKRLKSNIYNKAGIVYW